MSSARRPLLSLLLCVVFIFGGCDNSDTAPDFGTDIPGILQVQGDYTRLLEVISSTSIESTLRGNGPYTVFAPTDLAFEFIGQETLNRLLSESNSMVLERVLEHHIVQGTYTLADLTDGLELETIGGSTLSVERIDEEVRVDGTRIIEPDVTADNGLIHGIDDIVRSNLDVAARIMLTPILQNYTSLTAESNRLAGLSEINQVTVFAPIDQAFDQLGTRTNNLIRSNMNQDVLDRIVDFHIAPGIHQLEEVDGQVMIESQDGALLNVLNENGTLYVDGYHVVSEPVQTSNGILYLLGGVNRDHLNIEQRLRISSLVTTYSAEVQRRPDLRDLLASGDGYTVFASLDFAFANLNDQIFQAINAPINADLLDKLIRVHVVEGVYTSADLIDGLILTSIEGSELTVSNNNGQIFIKNGSVEEADVPVENGALHFVNQILLPDLDLIDQSLMLGRVQHVEALRRTSLESTFRESTAKTLFTFPDAVYDAEPSLFDEPNLGEILRYYAAAYDIGPLEHGLLFESMEGTNRTVAQDPGDPNIFRLDGVTQISFTRNVTNGRLMSAETYTLPPALRASR